MSERNRTKYTILGILTIKPSSGYEIAKLIKKSTNYFWSESEGQIYPALAKCVADGYALCEEIHGKQRNKKIYTITALGKKILNEWLIQTPQKTLIRSEFLLKLFFAGNMDKRDIIKHLENFQKDSENELEQLQEANDNLKSNQLPQAKFWRLSLKYGMQVTMSELLWCQETLIELNTK